MRYLSILFTVLLPCFLSAQQENPFLATLSFKDTSFYEPGRAAFIQDKNGNYYIAAVRKTSFTLYREISITKLDADKKAIWSKRYFDVSNSANPQEVFLQSQSDGNFLLVWSSEVSAGYFKFMPDGNVLWSKRFSGVQKEQILAIQPIQDDLIMAGHRDNNPFVCHIRSDGTVKWATAVPDSTLSFFHNSRFEGLWVDPTEGIVACGYLSPTIDITNLQAYFAKFDYDGNLLWGKRYERGWLKYVRPMPNGQWILGGNLDKINAGAWLLKTDASGGIVWSKKVKYSNGDFVDLKGLLTDPNYQIQASFGNSLLGLGDYGQSICTFDTAGKFLQGFRQNQDSAELFAFSMRYDSLNGILATLSLKGNSYSYVQFGRYNAAGELPGCCSDNESLITEEIARVTSDYKPVIKGISIYNFPLLPVDIKPLINILCEYQPVDVSFKVSDTLICPGECVLLSRNSEDTTKIYNWSISDGSTVVQADKSITVCFSSPGIKIIELSVIDKCLSFKYSDTVIVSIKNETTPNAFTPNGDDANDTFAPITQCDFSEYSFSIYNRWGSKVFTSTAPEQKWNGRVDGQDAPMDVYAWVVAYTLVKKGESTHYVDSGSITLLR